ncbi:L-lysine 6-transaminase [Dactylosporangium roseum]|uniref:L-lysine-epsilon aminotransferase n=1 Tax=Dactylosporangium roseum TaxID=47989 RepID=A0ABY5ZAJ9_9ACTN|nr:L-lysine 6-transaminase [Dactylosporangium roseum]UWZ39115.1 L-lysine 6-transaminase [Dactylosporangium roseum]
MPTRFTLPGREAAPAPDAQRARDAEHALALLRRHVTADFLDLVVDLERSAGCWLVDARTGRRHLDMMGYYGSAPLGHNHPGLVADPRFDAEVLAAARAKPSNPDFATLIQARFVETFLRVLGDPEMPYLFFIDGGALAVENALKVAFDYKTRRNAARGIAVRGWRVLHLRHAFHGRSGYTMSVTNTGAKHTWAFPQFDWPRIPSPAVDRMQDWDTPGRTVDEQTSIAAAEAAFARHPDEIACVLTEPIQCEGGDRHLRAPFLRALQELCERHDALFVLDEVQTGAGVTGHPWAYQALGLAPDLVAFGKKTQVCGVMGGRRVRDLPDNAFVLPGRLSSTWGGNVLDMLRATRILEIYEQEGLLDNATLMGARLLEGLRTHAERWPALLSAPRGRGLLCAVDVADRERRDRLVALAWQRHGALFLGCGERTLRFRPPLSVTADDIDAALTVLHDLCAEVASDAGD